ncbi:hypothetical protein NKW55_14420 [Gluconobacter kondonii]|uniref:hypothetical protein n=1 Tax=Gluconobacter kondonii TaxID=941463 RepID=UPI001C3F50EC|nr:hypothetical protein [Gluconobacter kondonii]MCP1237770.1 hypothetical protein [Gluconobacter kondonii]
MGQIRHGSATTTHAVRAAIQRQYSELLELAPSSDRIQKAVIFAKSHLVDPLTVEQLTEVAALSPRQFARAFRAETGQTTGGGSASDDREDASPDGPNCAGIRLRRHPSHARGLYAQIWSATTNPAQTG